MTREIIKSDRPPYGEPAFYPYVVPAYRGGDVGAWSPADIPGIADYGIRNLASLSTSRIASSGGVASVGDLVGSWDGELDVLHYRATSDSFRPILGTSGVRFTTAAAGTRNLEENSGAISRAADQPVSIIMITQGPSGATYVDLPIFDLRVISGATTITGWAAPTVGQQSIRVRALNDTATPPASYEGRNYFGTVYNGTTAWHWTNDTKEAVNVGASGDTITGSRMQNNNFPKDIDVVAWVIVYDDISDADWARLMTWGASL